MREILFRGKRIRPDEDTGKIEWVYGNYMTVYGVPNIEHDNKQSDIDRNTLGQYTGLKDKNGARIFEGDIVEYNGTKHRVVFENRFQTAYFGIVMSTMETWGFSNSVPANMMEVIGNIHDNPELFNRLDEEINDDNGAK